MARSGMPEILVVLTPLALAVFYFFSILPLQNKHTELFAMLNSKHDLPKKAVRQDPEEQLASFYGHFQPEKSFFGTLEKLHDIAEKNGIDLPKGDYEYGEDGKLAHYDIVFPVQGSYGIGPYWLLFCVDTKHPMQPYLILAKPYGDKKLLIENRMHIFFPLWVMMSVVGGSVPYSHPKTPRQLATSFAYYAVVMKWFAQEIRGLLG